MIKITILIVALFLNACASDFINYNIKQNNNIKTISVQQKGDTFIASKKYSFNNNTNIVIKFEQITPELISEFETKYSLQLEQIMITGSYIYSHKSTNILETIEFISNEANVIEVLPLWRKSIRMY